MSQSQKSFFCDGYDFGSLRDRTGYTWCLRAVVVDHGLRAVAVDREEKTLKTHGKRFLEENEINW